MSWTMLGAIRQAAGMSQPQVAKVWKKHSSWVSKIERGEFELDDDGEELLARLYGVSREKIRDAHDQDSARYLERFVAARSKP